MRRFPVLALLLLPMLLFAQDIGEQRAVSVREAELRSTPSFLSAIEARLSYGVLVEILEVRGPWLRVLQADEGVEGWLAASAVDEPQSLNLAAGDGNREGATTREIALAGRGFNEQIESEYKDQNDLDFAAVDRMEAFVLPVEELAEFLSAVNADLSLGGEE